MLKLLSVSSLQISILEITYSKIYIQSGTKIRPNVSLHYVRLILIDTEKKRNSESETNISKKFPHFLENLQYPAVNTFPTPIKSVRASIA
jgi:hypothetical protein